MRRTPGNAAWSLMLMAPLAAQHRAPCTGVVRDPAGAVMAGAQVVCVWTPDGGSLAPAEYHETTTDAAGRFGFPIAIGRAHCIWAIGPAEADGRRRVVPPSFDAVGGRELALVADRVTAPAQLQVTGANSWLRAGPLALRILVAGDAALPDLVIPGDGLVKLPPLPTPHVAVCLLDGRRAVIDSKGVDVVGLTPCAFGAAVEVEFVVDDVREQPVVGARIVTRGGVAGGMMRRFAGRSVPARGLREVAVTDVAGKARGFVPAMGHTAFFAMHDGASSGFSGTWGDQRVENGEAVGGEPDAPYHLRIEQPGLCRADVAGVGDDVVLHGAVNSSVFVHFRNGGGGWRWQLPLTRDGEGWSGLRFGTPYVGLLGEGSGEIPLRLVAWKDGVNKDGVNVDLTTLRTLDVTVVGADGAAVPFAEVGVTSDVDGFPVNWQTQLVTDAVGRARFRLMSGDCDLYAITADAHGLVTVTDAAATAVTIRMQPLANLRVRVVDEEGRPVAGAHLAVMPRASAAAGIGRVVQDVFRHPCESRFTDANGVLVGRVPRELENGADCTVTWRGVSSKPFPLQLDPESPIDVVLPR